MTKKGNSIVVADAGQAAYLVTKGFELSSVSSSRFFFDAELDDVRRAVVCYVSSPMSQFDGHAMALKKLRDFPGMTGIGDPVKVNDVGVGAYLLLLKFELVGASRDDGFWFSAGSEETRKEIGAAIAEYAVSEFAEFSTTVSDLCARRGRSKR